MHCYLLPLWENECTERQCIQECKYAYANINQVAVSTSQIRWQIARVIRHLIFTVHTGFNTFSRQIFSRPSGTSCYVNHITGRFYGLHSSGIMKAIADDLRRIQEWGLSLGFATEVSTLAFLQASVAESLNPLHAGTQILHYSSH